MCDIMKPAKSNLLIHASRIISERNVSNGLFQIAGLFASKDKVGEANDKGVATQLPATPEIRGEVTID